MIFAYVFEGGYQVFHQFSDAGPLESRYGEGFQGGIDLFGFLNGLLDIEGQRRDKVCLGDN
jgi:hypothetical protein